MTPPRALVFDLDDTLYPHDRFVRSGLMRVAALVADEIGVPVRSVVRTMAAARREAPGRELQALCSRFDMPWSSISRLVDAIRAHEPRLRLPAASRQVLEQVRPRWRVGILTNGRPDMQRRKIAALGLEPLVDAVVCAHEVGQGIGKPDAMPFLDVLDRLDDAAARAVFVGDDLIADVHGAEGVGMRTIQYVPAARGRMGGGPGSPDAVVGHLGAVPAVAERLLTEEWDVEHV
jgi:putative hydrolase of the HAD superfamily